MFVHLVAFSITLNLVLVGGVGEMCEVCEVCVTCTRCVELLTWGAPKKQSTFTRGCVILYHARGVINLPSSSAVDSAVDSCLSAGDVRF